jgi:hypothetical protein
VILWLNGAFGVGKTTVARHITAAEANWRLFDPELVGSMLRANLAGVAIVDFQDFAPWRTLVPVVAREIAMHTGSDLVAVQTVIVEDYWKELRAGFEANGLELRHVVLDCDASTLRTRIGGDPIDRRAATWRLDHVDAYASARDWMVAAADVVVDTAGLDPAGVATQILDALR